MGPDLVPEPPSRGRAHAGTDQSALARPVPRERRRLEHAGVPEGVLLQSRCADGPPDCVSRVVSLRPARTDGPRGEQAPSARLSAAPSSPAGTAPADGSPRDSDNALRLLAIRN